MNNELQKLQKQVEDLKKKIEDLDKINKLKREIEKLENAVKVLEAGGILPEKIFTPFNPLQPIFKTCCWGHNFGLGSVCVNCGTSKHTYFNQPFITYAIENNILSGQSDGGNLYGGTISAINNPLVGGIKND